MKPQRKKPFRHSTKIARIALLTAPNVRFQFKAQDHLLPWREAPAQEQRAPHSAPLASAESVTRSLSHTVPVRGESAKAAAIGRFSPSRLPTLSLHEVSISLNAAFKVSGTIRWEISQHNIADWNRYLGQSMNMSGKSARNLLRGGRPEALGSPQ